MGIVKQMLTKEVIIKVLKYHISIEQTGYMNGCADLVGIEDAAEQILLFIQQPNLIETSPELD